mgnify:CR=1 FL=1
MSSGNIVQVIGAVVDVEFPRDQLPKVYDALFMEDRGLTLEVQQQLGARQVVECGHEQSFGQVASCAKNHNRAGGRSIAMGSFGMQNVLSHGEPLICHRRSGVRMLR